MGATNSNFIICGAHSKYAFLVKMVQSGAVESFKRIFLYILQIWAYSVLINCAWSQLEQGLNASRSCPEELRKTKTAVRIIAFSWTFATWTTAPYDMSSRWTGDLFLSERVG